MIHIEPKEHVLVIRGGEHFKEYGDPYEYVCIVIPNGSVAVVEAMAGKLPPGFLGEITENLLAMGFTKAMWQRRKNNVIKDVERDEQ